MIISIVPDTNVLIDSLDIINRLANDEHPYNIRIVILSRVLYELDRLKKDNNKARMAIDFFLYNKNEIIQIEGALNSDVMEVINEYPKSEMDNVPFDILIASSASYLENSVMLTYDKNMILFCKTKNVKAVYMEGLKYDEVKLAIYTSHMDLEPMEIIEDTILCDRRLTEECLKPLILKIIKNEIGPGVEAYKDKFNAYTIEMLIDFIIKEFYLFENYIPKNSKAILVKINSELKKKNDDQSSKKALQNILTIFRIKLKL